MILKFLIVMTLNLLCMDRKVACTICDSYDTFPTNLREMVNELKTNTPIIGVVAMPMKNIDLIEGVPAVEDKSHMAASFIKLVEGAGGRVIPLLETFNNKKIKELLGKINGVLLPGGLENINNSEYHRISELAFNYSIKKYKNGEVWPMLGICRGFQQLLTLLKEEDVSCITPTDSKNISLKLEFTAEANQSRLMRHAPPKIWSILSTKDVAFNAHYNGFSPDALRKSTKLNNTWRIISTNKDRKGKSFISTVEGREYPMYGLQWHPEKPLYVWNPSLMINHSVYSIMVSQYMANFFMLEARKNSNAFKSREEAEDYMIYQYNTTYVGIVDKSPYEEVYLWTYE